MGNKLVPVLK